KNTLFLFFISLIIFSAPNIYQILKSFDPVFLTKGYKLDQYDGYFCNSQQKFISYFSKALKNPIFLGAITSVFLVIGVLLLGKESPFLYFSF
ncbi:hypothetical protein BVY03_06060, partial [bacterium K02(2017)]